MCLRAGSGSSCCDYKSKLKISQEDNQCKVSHVSPSVQMVSPVTDTIQRRFSAIKASRSAMVIYIHWTEVSDCQIFVFHVSKILSKEKSKK